MPWRYTTAAHEARLQAVADLLNAGAGCTAKIYDAGSVLLAEMALTDPIHTAIGTGGALALAGTMTLAAGPFTDASANASGTPARCDFIDAGSEVVLSAVIELLVDDGRFQTVIWVDPYAGFQEIESSYSVALSLGALYTDNDPSHIVGWDPIYYSYVTYSEAALNARLQSIADLLDGGILELWSGAIPTALGDTPAGDLLAMLDLPATFAGSVAAGVLTSNAITAGEAVAAGTPAFCRLKTSGDALVAEVEAGTSGLIFDNTTWLVGTPVSVSPLVIRG